ncbi:MAG: response regulator [Pseudanabaena sp. SU_2_4]|nr:response regulator [Pseudanabaena sp. SU_2_4]NKB17901.1 response regulator [Pseudanabaena sp. CRU_2_10]
MDFEGSCRSFEVLLVEDNPGDAQLTKIALEEGKVRIDLNVVEDGVEALLYLRRIGKYATATQPDLILLDLNLPKKDGCEVLTEIKADEALKRIPVVILTTSQSEEDILKIYNLNANCYITKPVDFERFVKIVQSIEHFWFTIVQLPPQ